MKKSFTTEAINLRNYPLNENDSIVVMFSKTKGLMHAVAKGVKRPKSKLCGRIQMFIANKLLLYEGRKLSTITDIESLNTFLKIRNDYDKLAYSMYIAELVDSFCSKIYNADEAVNVIYELIFKVYEHIAEAKTKDEVLLYVIRFMVKFLDTLGWGIDFKSCSICQKDLSEDLSRSSIFSFETGGFLCEDCTEKIQGEAIRIHNKIKLFLYELYIADMDTRTKYDDIAGSIVVQKCFDFMKKYAQNLSNRRTKVLEVLDRSEKTAIKTAS